MWAGTSYKKSDTLELKIVKKHIKVMAHRKNIVSKVFDITFRGWSSMILPSQDLISYPIEEGVLAIK